MKKRSVKFKITLWLTLLAALLTVILLAVSLAISSFVANDAARQQLISTAEKNMKYITATESKPVIEEGFVYYHNGVSTLVYSQNGSLLAGQVPVNFKTTAEFDNNSLRTVENNGNEFIIIDIWIPMDWNNGVWMRSISDAPDNDYFKYYLVHIAAITLPGFTLLAALGSYWIIKRSLRPLDRINTVIEDIKEAKDLSGRINLPAAGYEFTVLANDFDEMLERLERSFEREKQFTSDASHELRTPVAIIKSACEYSEKFDETAQEYKESIGMIHRQADRMSNIIQQLLNLTRMEYNADNLSLEKTDLMQLVTDICSEQNWQQEKIHLSAGQQVFAQVDKTLIARLVINLVENAFKYSDKSGEVWISVQKIDTEIHLSVKDNGTGIAEEHLDKIWGRFYQIDKARTAQDSGIGVGLAMVKRIAEMHKGYMTVQSQQGKGSMFTLHLPI